MASGSERMYENAEDFVRNLQPVSSEAHEDEDMADKESVGDGEAEPGGVFLPPKTFILGRQISKTSSVSSKTSSSYDEMSLNNGRPVIVTGNEDGGDTLTAVAFGSPLKDVKEIPVPAPRLSKKCILLPETAGGGVCADSNDDDDDPNKGAIYEELIPRHRHPTPASSSEETDSSGNIYSELVPSTGDGHSGSRAEDDTVQSFNILDKSNESIGPSSPEEKDGAKLLVSVMCTMCMRSGD